MPAPDIEPSGEGSICREPLYHGTHDPLEYWGRCGLPAGQQFMGTPLCTTHLWAALGRSEGHHGHRPQEGDPYG